MRCQVVAATLLCLAATAWGHGILTNPAPRTGANIAGDNKGNANVGACGDGNQQTKGPPASVVTAGQEITVAWSCEIPHGGTCAISLDTTSNAPGTNDDGTYNVDGDGIITQHTLAPKFDCCDNRGQETKTVTIPADAACENCVLQWWWDGDASYFDCSDITVNALGDGDSPPGALLAPAAFKLEDMNEAGAVAAVFATAVIVGIFVYRIKTFKEDEDAVYDAYESGWPSRGGVMIRAFLVFLRLVCFVLLCMVPSFSSVQSMLLMVVLCFLFGLKEVWVLHTTKKNPDRFEEKKMWYMLLISTFVEAIVFGYATFMTTIRKYATWVIEDDQGESADTQEDMFMAACFAGWLVLAGLSYQLLHEMAMVGACIPGEGLLEAGEKEVAFLEKKKKKKSDRLSKKSKKKSGKKGSKGSKKKKKKSGVRDAEAVGRAEAM